MDIKVSNVDPLFIREIDKKTKDISTRIGRKFSRNEYIKMLIQNDAELRLTEIKEQKFDEVVKNLMVAVERQEKTLQEFINSNSRLFHLMASGENIIDKVDEID
ncbi:hypothetical protein BME96_18900 (plasmid) [Virgibacillus halodenitrificans]|uniref:Uncharacterized protein n=1 Tax=Virgibacillus halodenitrificans TaxID=1482 RepID=A0AAC9J4M7_VIRHA|nr:hypothetical protein [Virgibacillus halodenitrificans]APC50352.1 hypothetical protein BME96_18900 [Virgibacillus halodenitrificans]AVD54441.1 hypothetical protein CKF96_02710 [Priestia filamentosa]AVD54609.1 hypothetical protein CKF96_03710 [Priestia filamentosa]CDQ37719.1 hypothetical protein BN993_07281 [Virgibacillus halodenitrificans]